MLRYWLDQLTSFLTPEAINASLSSDILEKILALFIGFIVSLIALLHFIFVGFSIYNISHMLLVNETKVLAFLQKRGVNFFCDI